MANDKNSTSLFVPNDSLIRDATLFDDWFFRRFIKDYPAGAELIIRICLGRDDLHVIDLRVQEPFNPDNTTGKDGLLDVWAKDDAGEIYNIEVQYDSRGASPKRAFHYLSLMTQYELSKGTEYDSRPNCYVIFITKTDYFGENQPFYWLSGFRSDGKNAEIGAYIIYINGAWKGNDPIGRLVKDMAQADPTQIHYPEISNRIKDLKTPKSEVNMSGSLAFLRDKWTQDGWNEGHQDGWNESKKESIYQYVQLLAKNLQTSTKEALKLLNITEEEYEAARQSIEANHASNNADSQAAANRE